MDSGALILDERRYYSSLSYFFDLSLFLLFFLIQTPCAFCACILLTGNMTMIVHLYLVEMVMT